ncbi:Aste57867_10943 [Aphanomyces stellatus]|uniref:Aste57867_10943 protein n=1 Tax=Aphanomyces stellatus TaxID=120398 RepID=A0A485KRM2_9STRA|nr:hypothetical protein As57867_010903 [Aphanomyces stellatus]VFT87811.1 Aste57867_10943 [Aphanomyces stellatus]
MALSTQSMFQMYWGLANDFTAVAVNSSGIGGMSLIRSSPNFAFANTTAEMIIIGPASQFMAPTSMFDLTRTTLGPYGSVDMYVIPCPVEAKIAIYNVFQAVNRLFFYNKTALNVYNQLWSVGAAVDPVPKAWTNPGFNSMGGNLLCPPSEPNFIRNGFRGLFSANGPCNENPSPEIVHLTPPITIVAAFLANATTMDRIVASCGQIVLSEEKRCIRALNATTTFIATYLSDLHLSLLPLIGAANLAVFNLNVELIQFGFEKANSRLGLYQVNVVDPTETEFSIFAWHLLVEWAQGDREVVRFEGDVGSISLLSKYMTNVRLPVNEIEFPTNLSYYLRKTVSYITFAVIVLASLVLVYIVLSRGYIEALNLFELQRVGAIVWIGRPLLFVRSLTAVGLLSTASLELTFDGFLSYFQVIKAPWYKTLLAANEVTWMVAIVNDIAMAFTREYTMYYATVNSVMIWLLTAMLGLQFPVSHSVTIDVQCSWVQVDYQVECTSGVISIGYISRLMLIIGLVLSSNIFCYAVTRCLVRNPKSRTLNSIFLYGGTRYLFMTNDWTYNNIYYIDRASAVLNGILTLRWRQTIIALDIKLWRVFHADILDEPDVRQNDPLAQAVAFALPLSVNMND